MRPSFFCDFLFQINIKMELQNYLPKELIYIVEDYAKDRTNYDKVLFEFHHCITWKWAYGDNIFELIKSDREQKNKEWYLNCKQYKKPHGKQQPTIRDRRHKYKLRFGIKALHGKKFFKKRYKK